MEQQHKLSDGYLSKPKAATYTDVSPRTLDYAVERGELRAFRLVLTSEKGKSRKVLFRKSDLDAWIERCRVSADLDKIVDETVAEVLGK